MRRTGVGRKLAFALIESRLDERERPLAKDAHHSVALKGVPHTADGKPWSIDVIVELVDERRVVAFEKYLKSGSGCAFTQRHFR